MRTCSHSYTFHCLSYFTANSCVPVMKLSVKPEMVYVTMAHMDDSLEEEYGVHIVFNISFWKVDNGGYSKVTCVLHTQKNHINLFIHYISLRGLL